MQISACPRNTFAALTPEVNNKYHTIPFSSLFIFSPSFSLIVLLLLLLLLAALLGLLSLVLREELGILLLDLLEVLSDLVRVEGRRPTTP